MSDNGPSLSDVLEGDADADKYNERVEQEMDARIETMRESEQDAVDALRESAQESLDTAAVSVGEIQLEVLTRIPPDVEDLIEEMDDAEVEGDRHRARRLNAAALAQMVESPEGYTSPDVWVVAAEQNGTHWFGEVTDIVLAPARENAEELGNRNSPPDSDDSLHQTTGKQSGWQQQR